MERGGMYAPSKENFRAYAPALPEQQGLEHELAFTKKQRDWYLRVYGDRCQFPYEKDDGTHKICGSKNQIQVHHIIPASWTLENDPEQDPNNTPGIALCRHHHINYVHPEIGEALRNYQQDPEAIKRAVQWHKDMAAEQTIFWVDEWDDLFLKIYEYKVEKFISEHPESSYPEDKKWARKHKGVVLQ